MPLNDLHLLPRVRDSWSYLYVEHCTIEQDAQAIAIVDQRGTTHVPCTALTLLMIGPGATISHAAVRTLTLGGCLIAWTGEAGVRCYASGAGETRSAANLLRQVACHADPDWRLSIVRRLYTMRFAEPLEANLTLQQIRGKEGARVRDLYAHWSRATGVPWSGRAYQSRDWNAAEPINQALSAANACLYGVVHAAILSAGYSPAIGFIHTGLMLSFVYDIADLYKATITIPAAFRCVAAGDHAIESRVRHHCRDRFREERVLPRIVDDIDRLFAVRPADRAADDVGDRDGNPSGRLWDPMLGSVPGGVNYAESADDQEDMMP